MDMLIVSYFILVRNIWMPRFLLYFDLIPCILSIPKSPLPFICPPINSSSQRWICLLNDRWGKCMHQIIRRLCHILLNLVTMMIIALRYVQTTFKYLANFVQLTGKTAKNKTRKLRIQELHMDDFSFSLSCFQCFVFHKDKNKFFRQLHGFTILSYITFSRPTLHLEI